MQKYLITGASGFVARHFLNLLEETGEPCEVLGLDVAAATVPRYRFKYDLRVLNLLDAGAIEECLLSFRPTRILHLASFSSVGASWKTPVESFSNNTNIFLNLIDPIRRHGLPTKILSVGSSEEYGYTNAADLPLVETRSLSPESPYGVARVAQEQLSQVFAEGYGVDVVMTRSFNHIGPGQRDQFVVPSFVKQFVTARRNGQGSFVLRAGNTKVVRDFLDVRDVVRAYLGLLERGRRGEVYNICSGQGRSLDEVLNSLSRLTGVQVTTEVDAALLRPNELMEIVGSSRKLEAALAWKPRYSFEASLADMIAYWDEKLNEEGSVGLEQKR